MKYFSVIVFLFLSLNVFSKNKHPIYNQIIKNMKGNIDKNYAMQLSNIIYKYSRKYEIPAKLFTAILMQESNYNIRKHNQTCGFDLNSFMKELGHKMTVKPENYKKWEKCVVKDVGISNINYKNLEAHGFDVIRLVTDLDYSVEAGAIILADFKNRYQHKELEYWLRYNCGERGSINRKSCKKYKKDVLRWIR